MKHEKSRSLYVDTRLDGKPEITTKAVLNVLWQAGRLDQATWLSSVSGRPGRGRKKLKVTITVGEVS